MSHFPRMNESCPRMNESCPHRVMCVFMSLSQVLHGLQVCCKCVEVCCSALQCVAVRCSALQCAAVCCSEMQCVAVCCSALQCVAVRCSVLQCVAVRCSALQCVAVCCRSFVRISHFPRINESCPHRIRRVFIWMSHVVIYIGHVPQVRGATR